MKIILLLTSLFLCITSYGQSFTEIAGTPFEGVLDGSIAFSDVDGDNDQDLIITGANSFGSPTTKLYLNDGHANFTESTDSPFDRVQKGTLSIVDIDGDNDEDVFITGINNSFSRIAKLYKNDGNGNFTEVDDLPFTGVQDGAVAIADIDGDNDQDIFITGRNSPIIPSNPISILYVNDGDGNFTETVNNPFTGVFNSSVAFADIDGDNDQDLFLTGEDNSDNSISELYINDGLGIFVKKINTPFVGVRGGAIAFADIDNDNDQDLFIGSGNVSKIYINDGAGEFTEKADNPIESVIAGAIAFVDIDNDSDQDLMISGRPQTGRISKLYLNDGVGTFSELKDTPFDNADFSALAIADIDGDNDQDILLAGENDSNQKIAKLYQNDLGTTNIDLFQKQNNDFKIYPNPTSASEIYIDYISSAIGLVTLEILDTNGRIVNMQKLRLAEGKQTIEIDISSLNSGVYILSVQKGNSISQKIFVVH